MNRVQTLEVTVSVTRLYQVSRGTKQQGGRSTAPRWPQCAGVLTFASAQTKFQLVRLPLAISISLFSYVV